MKDLGCSRYGYEPTEMVFQMKPQYHRKMVKKRSINMIFLLNSAKKSSLERHQRVLMIKSFNSKDFGRSNNFEAYFSIKFYFRTHIQIEYEMERKKLIDGKRDPIFTVIVDYGSTGFFCMRLKNNNIDVNKIGHFWNAARLHENQFESVVVKNADAYSWIYRLKRWLRWKDR